MSRTYSWLESLLSAHRSIFWSYFVAVLPVITFLTIGKSLNSPLSIDDEIALSKPLTYIIGLNSLPPLMQLLAPYFDHNPGPYFALSLVLRIICAASFYPLVNSLVGSRTFAVLATTLFAVGNPGIENSERFAGNMGVFIGIALANLGLYAHQVSRTTGGWHTDLAALSFLTMGVLAYPLRMSSLLIFPLLYAFWLVGARSSSQRWRATVNFLAASAISVALYWQITSVNWYGPRVEAHYLPGIWKMVSSFGYIILPFDAMYIPFSGLYARGLLGEIVTAYTIIAGTSAIVLIAIALARRRPLPWIPLGLWAITAAAAGGLVKPDTPLDLYALLVGGISLIVMASAGVTAIRVGSYGAGMQLFALIWSFATVAATWLITTAAGTNMTAFYSENRYLLVPFAAAVVFIASALDRSKPQRLRAVSFIVMLLLIAVNALADHHFFQRMEKLRGG